LGAACHASWNVLLKAGSDPLLDTVSVTTSVVVVTSILLLFLPAPLEASWSCLGASVVIHVAYFGFLVLAYQRGDLSIVYPIMRGTAPALSALLTVALLGEHPSEGGWVGVFLVSAGVLLLAADGPRCVGTRLSAAVFALLNAGVIVAYTLVDGVGARLSGNALSYTGWLLLLNGSLIFVMASLFRGRRVTLHFRAQWKKWILGGSCTSASYGMALWAMTKAPIALVAALRETSIIFGVLLAAFVLKEHITPLRCVSVAIVAAGAVAIKVF